MQVPHDSDLSVVRLWVEAVQEIVGRDQTSDQICHTDCIFGQRKQSIWRRLGLRKKLLRPKWVAIPSRCDERTTWTVHSVMAAEKAMRAARSRRSVYRHFRAPTIQPKTYRRHIRRYMPTKHVLDRELISAFERLFGRRQGALDSRFARLRAWLRGCRISLPSRRRSPPSDGSGGVEQRARE